jgi:hypothetical protein
MEANALTVLKVWRNNHHSLTLTIMKSIAPWTGTRNKLSTAARRSLGIYLQNGKKIPKLPGQFQNQMREL